MKKHNSIPLVLAGSLLAVGVSAGRLAAFPPPSAGVSHAHAAVADGEVETAGGRGDWGRPWEKQEEGMIVALVAVLATSLLCVAAVGLIVLWEGWGHLTGSKGRSRIGGEGQGPRLPLTLPRNGTNRLPPRPPRTAPAPGPSPFRDLRAARPANYPAKAEEVKGIRP
jgi:hypothetical protein